MLASVVLRKCFRPNLPGSFRRVHQFLVPLPRPDPLPDGTSDVAGGVAVPRLAVTGTERLYFDAAPEFGTPQTTPKAVRAASPITMPDW